MEGINVGGSVVTLVELVGRIYGMLREGDSGNGKRILEHVKALQDALHQFSEMPPHIFQNVSRELQLINDDLNSIFNPSTTTSCSLCPSMITWMCSTMCGSCVRRKLDEIDERLQKLRTRYLCGALLDMKNDIKKHIPAIANENIDLPSSTAGLDRAHLPLKFIDEKKNGLRIVGIHGQGGIGKTTLLHKIWEDVSLKPPFTARAFVVVGEEATPQSLCALQSSILEQLGVVDGERKFPSPDFGKWELKKRMLSLKSGSKAIFLAIDNVWESVHLEILLPEGLASLLPPSSCIVLTSRQSHVIQTLIDLCPFQISDQSHVLFYAPECLSLEDSRLLFAHTAGTGIENHPKLLHAIVPLCGGLPLALKLLGSLFISEARREEPAWKEVCAKMQLQEASFPAERRTMFQVLQVSYERLEPSFQEAFLDIVGFFYGWEWHTVERIVGIDEMRTLKNHSLLTETIKLFQCKRSAIEYLGYPDEEILREHNVAAQKFVTMHDLILKFGKCLLEKKDRRLKITQDDLGVENARHSPYKNRFLWNATTEREMIQPIDLQGMKNLRFLHLHATDHEPLPELLILNVEIGEEQASSSFQIGCAQLRFVSLRNVTSNRIIMQTMISQELRELHLYNCEEIEELPPSSIVHLKKLEVLHINGCCSFRGLPEHCGNWEALQELFVNNCHRITELPVALGTLPNLRNLYVGSRQLMSFPALNDTKRLAFLGIEQCLKLALVPALPKSLEILVLSDSTELQKLPTSICQMTLETLHITRCTGLLELPEDMGNLKLLKGLNISGCSKLKKLPESICNITSLERLNVRGCSGLLELPEDMGNLKSLKRLNISECSKLNRLPESICNIVSLEGLNVGECSGLLELPEDMGNLMLSKELDLSKCFELKKLPKSICNITSLEILNLRECSGLLELPEDMGNLKLVKGLVLHKCSKLKRLPDSICNIASLEKLNIRECSGLLELPEDMGKLKSLKDLNISQCFKLMRLPNSIGSIESLERLYVCKCSGLLELPAGMGNLKSLEDLQIFGCSKLKRLPESICSIVSLKRLYVKKCSGVLELPEDMGNLKSLKVLTISECSELKRLPMSISNIMSLEELDVWECCGLLELPKDMGNLKSLKVFKIGCSELERLPESICSIVSLETLNVWECCGLLELPEDMGNLKFLKDLEISDCSRLKRLPESIFSNMSLKILDLNKCFGLLELPEDMGNLKSLKSLNISKCSKLKRLPESICNITSLERLIVRECSGLLELPEDIGNFKLLKDLDLNSCSMLERLPKSICNITSLENLDLERCYELELPEDVGNLSSLILLDVSFSELERLPKSVCNITTLESLHIQECSGLLELPEELGNLKSLKELFLCHCLKLERLPKSICEIMVLKVLDLRRCSSLLELPKEIGKLTCLEKLKVGGCSRLPINLPCLGPKVVVDWNDN